MAYLRLVTGQELYQRTLFYCSWHKVHHYCIHHAAGLSVTVTILVLVFCFIWHERNCRISSECMMMRELQADSLDAVPLDITALRRNSLPTKVIDNVESFVIFLGMEDRSFGQLLNHHPEVAIAGNFNLFQRWNFENTVLQNKSLLLTLLVAHATIQHTNMLKALEGITHKLTVVGDHSTFNLTELCATSPLYCCHVSAQLQKVLRIPVKFIQVVANPYDSISAMTLLSLQQARTASAFSFEYITVNDEKSALIDSTERYFNKARQLTVFKQQSRVRIHYVHWYDLQQDAVGTLQSLCDFLTIPCSEEYMELAQNFIALIKFHRPRSQVTWTEDLIAAVEQQLTDIPWIQRYRYNRDVTDIL